MTMSVYVRLSVCLTDCEFSTWTFKIQ